MIDTTRDKIGKVLEEMLAANEKISIYSVAEKCGISHSLIYNRYPDLKERIKELKGVQRERSRAADDETAIATLTAKNKALREKLQTRLLAAKSGELKLLLGHVQEVYSMYDGLLEDRNRLAEKLASSK